MGSGCEGSRFGSIILSSTLACFYDLDPLIRCLYSSPFLNFVVLAISFLCHFFFSSDYSPKSIFRGLYTCIMSILNYAAWNARYCYLSHNMPVTDRSNARRCG